MSIAGEQLDFSQGPERIPWLSQQAIDAATAAFEELWALSDPITANRSDDLKEFTEASERALAIRNQLAQSLGELWKFSGDKFLDHLGQPGSRREVLERFFRALPRALVPTPNSYLDAAGTHECMSAFALLLTRTMAYVQAMQGIPPDEWT